jgi:predicted DNA-binding protein
MNALPLNQVNHRRIENYARLTGQTVSAVLEEALTFWMDAMGDPVLEELQRREIEAQAEAQAQEFLERLRNGKARVVVFPG